jgi:hypothetical protein
VNEENQIKQTEAKAKAKECYQGKEFANKFFAWVREQSTNGEFEGTYRLENPLSKGEWFYLRSFGYFITKEDVEGDPQYKVSWY